MHPSRRPCDENRLARFESLEPRLYLTGNTAAHDLTGLSAVRDEYGLTGAGQTVAVIDTGIAYDHAALGGGLGAAYRVVGGYDFTDERDADPYDDGPFGSHGTHAAGIIGSDSATNAGVAPNVDLVGLRIYDDYGNTYFHWLEEALQWVHRNRVLFENPITTVSISMGVYRNSDTLPDWAMLEDEFAQLEADGIFISVAAGNNFASFGTPGLSYPAVSPHVVPVASVDNDGGLSSFSQRDDRVIAAPGRSITSTVPDYVGDYNGMTDDFAQYSGTSTAAPYVAGASVLIREAYQFAGVAEVDQQMIYDLMVQTADTVYDSATGQSYHRLNLDAAIDAVMPAADPPPVDPPPVDVPPDEVPPDDTLPVDTLPAAIDWGTVRQAIFNGYRIDSPGQPFTVTAAVNGWLTVEAFFSHAEGDVDLELFDAAGNLVASSSSNGDTERVDVTASAGETFTLLASTHGSSANEEVDFLATNLVCRTGNSAYVWGTEGNDRFIFTAGTCHEATINGVTYSFDASVVRSVTFNGLAGADSATLHGTGGSDVAVLQAGSAELGGTQYDVSVNHVERVDIDGGGGADTATFYDSAGNETFTGAPGYGRISGGQFENTAEGFENIFARAIAGGNDVARFYDSSGNDALVATATYSRLSGNGFAIHAHGFDQVHAFAVAGGYDRAEFHDSPGNDTYAAGPTEADFHGDGFFNRAKFFEEVHASATAGGYDTAEVYDSPGNDRLEAAADRAWLAAGGAVTWLYGFEHVHALSNHGGDDTAEIAAVDFILILDGAWN